MANDLRRSQQALDLSVHLIHFRLFQNVCHTFVCQSKWEVTKWSSEYLSHCFLLNSHCLVRWFSWQQAPAFFGQTVFLQAAVGFVWEGALDETVGHCGLLVMRPEGSVPLRGVKPEARMP